MAGAFAAAVEAFEETLEGFDSVGLQDLGDLVAFGRRAALLAVAEPVWRHHLGPSLTLDQVKRLLGVSSRQAVHDLRKRRRLLALNAASGRKVYPAFQFGEGGRPYPVLADILRIFAGVAESPHTVASWLVSPNPLLGSETPAAWMSSGGASEPLLKAAQRAAAQLAQ